MKSKENLKLNNKKKKYKQDKVTPERTYENNLKVLSH